MNNLAIPNMTAKQSRDEQFEARLVSALKQLLNALRLPAGREPTGMLHAYLSVASRYPADAVESVVHQYTIGEVPDQSLKFVPEPPEFSQAVKRWVEAHERSTPTGLTYIIKPPKSAIIAKKLTRSEFRRDCSRGAFDRGVIWYPTFSDNRRGEPEGVVYAPDPNWSVHYGTVGAAQ